MQQTPMRNHSCLREFRVVHSWDPNYNGGTTPNWDSSFFGLIVFHISNQTNKHNQIPYFVDWLGFDSESNNKKFIGWGWCLILDLV